MKQQTESTVLTESDKAAMRARMDLIRQVCERAEREIKGVKENIERSSLIMDLESVPELDLPKLLSAPNFDFAHDICGIIKNMDRSNWPGKLKNCFWPRCTK